MSETTLKYELMVILPNSMDEKQAQDYFSKTLPEKIKELKGKITFEDFWGSRGFAYKIKKQTWGYYGVLQFEMESREVLELRTDLNIDNSIVRFLLTKVPKKAPEPRKHEDMKKEWAAQEKEKHIEEIENNAAKKRPSPTKRVERVEPTQTEPDKTPQVTPAKPSEKTNTDTSKTEKQDLDKKLDKIIEDSSLDL